MGGDPHRHPLATEVATYLDEYRNRLGVQPTWGVRALSVERRAPSQGLTVTTTAERLTFRSVIAATGPFSIPWYPKLAERVVVAGVTLHSDQYTSPGQLPAGNVLVVGSGNSGIQVAHELAETHCVSIARGRPQPSLPRRWLGIDLFRWLQITGALSAPVTSPMGQLKARTEPVIGTCLNDLAANGVHVLPRAVDAGGDEVTFENGESRRFDSIVWATGYRPGFDWLPKDVTHGGLQHRKGLTPIDGLYILGAPWLRSRGSSLIGGVAGDAVRIASVLTRRIR